eukprot:XP_011682110.1 PREDICTED: GPI ethanolamine phosphate transferase 1 [Strongylocentrotus purpuratus]
MMDIYLVIVGFILHLILFASIFDIYFTSPLVHGMTPHSTPDEPPAKRLVLFVGDGLRADKLYELKEDGTSRAPYLRSILKNQGTWGVSHTRVPTESRPGHVAIIAGFYEDVSAVTKGWQENPVEFDSVFNQSRFTWSWGSPDILPMFAKGASGDHVFIHTYPPESEDFADSDASKLDTWVFDKVKVSPNVFSMMDIYLVIVGFILHLILFASIFDIYFTSPLVHGMTPHSTPDEPPAKRLVLFVGDGLRADKLYELKEDGTSRAPYLRYLITLLCTALTYCKGSHGASHPDETLTPLLAWGAGIREARHSTDQQFQDNFLQDWHLEDIERHDVSQADIAPLMTSLIGVPFPLNSVGVLPVDYLNGTEEYKARSLLTNAKQIIAQYEVKENQKFATTFRALFRPFKPLSSGQKELLLKHIHIHMARNRFKQAIAETEKLISLGLDGLGYYQTYDRFFLGSSVTLSYLGWMAYILHILLKYHTSLATPTKPCNHGKTHPRLLPAFCMIAVLITILLALQTSPINYYIYALTPVPLWYAVVKRWEVFHQSLVNITTRHSLQEIAGYSVLGVVAIETLVLSLFYREVISVGLVGVALWPLCSGVKHRNKMYSVGWLISCLVLAVFPMLPVVGRDPNIALVVLAGVLLAVSAYILFRHLLKLQSSSSINPLLTWLQIALLLISVMVVYITWIHITNKEGVPLPNKIFSWTMLLAAFVLPSFSSVVIGHRLLGVALSLSTVYMLLSTSHEGLFCLCLCYVMFFWILCESNLNQQQTDKIHQVSFNEEANLEKAPPRNLALTDLRCAWIFVFFILAAFFGTGNIASINSFDPSAVYCFLTVFNPFIMGSLLLMKNVILFLLVACAFQAIHILLRLPTSSLYLVVLLLSDAMALHFFFLVRDSGSWLEIGTSISHYVIVMSMILFIMLLLLLARLITTLSWKRSFKKHHAR